MIGLAWILAIVGAVVAFIISLAGAISSVPQLPWQDAILAVPVPLLAAGLAAWRLWGPVRPELAGRRKPWISAGLPLALAIFTLLFMAQSYFGQPSGPM